MYTKIESGRKNIVLTGFMGTGKTTVANELSRMLNMEALDLDLLIEQTTGLPIPEIFEKFGEAGFRRIESNVVEKVSDLCNRIIATGGGVVLNGKNIQLLRRNGVIILLRARPETILRNISGSHVKRPLLSVPDMGRINEMLAAREKYYQNCDAAVQIDGLTPVEVAAKVVEYYNHLTNGKGLC